jgi:hypothetical protein
MMVVVEVVEVLVDVDVEVEVEGLRWQSPTGCESVCIVLDAMFDVESDIVLGVGLVEVVLELETEVDVDTVDGLVLDPPPWSS